MPQRVRQNGVLGAAFLGDVKACVCDIASRHSIPLYHLFSTYCSSEKLAVAQLKIVTYSEDAIDRLHSLLDEAMVLGVPAESALKPQHPFKVLRFNAKYKAGIAGRDAHQFDLVICSILSEAYAGMVCSAGIDESVTTAAEKKELHKISSLLKMADEECAKLAKTLRLGNKHSDVSGAESGIHTLSYSLLEQYVNGSAVVREIDRQIAAHAGARISAQMDIDGDIERLAFVNINTVAKLNEALLENSREIVAFAEKWIGKDNGGVFDAGIALFYLEYLLVAKKDDNAFCNEYVLRFISDNDFSARYIIPTYKSIHGAEEQGSPAFS